MKSSQLADYIDPANAFAQLSLRDLLEARQKYHADLMQYPNVIATAIGRYRIRKGDSWPGGKGKTIKGTGVRTMDNSEVRPYSWPAILVLVEEWEPAEALAKRPGGLIPKEFWLDDGRGVPICVIEAPREERTEIEAKSFRFPVNNIGGGNSVLAQVQGREYAATIACLVSDGHKVYGLTNRHVTGEEGEVVYARVDGKVERIGSSAAKQLTRELFTEVYPGWPGQHTYVNLDAGLIEIDALDRWTAEIGDLGEMGRLVDLPVSSAMSLIGAPVRGVGGASGEMPGEIHGLFYRYKTVGGFEYVADLLIGPRTSGTPASATPGKFATHPGDSGALWLLEPRVKNDREGKPLPPRPLAMQWGRNMLNSAGKAEPQSYVLATFLATLCARLAVDPVRNWNLDQTDTWGAVGHFSIAARAPVALSNRFPKLASLITNNALIISHDENTILTNDFKGQGEQSFVPLADVPDFFWKPRIAKQGFARALEGPNHFADMDQPGPGGKTLLELCHDPAYIDAEKWNQFYDAVRDLLKGDPISQVHRGLLPFRVWQIFDAMTEFAKSGKGPEFLCAAGVLTHYIGDACQPLHISYLHDGDPLRKFVYTFKKGKKEGETEERALGAGVHAAYEDDMVSAHRADILNGLKQTPKTQASEMLANGLEAAQATIAMMRTTFTSLPPMEIVNAFADFQGTPKQRAEFFWQKFGAKTIKSMQSGAHLLAVLWESAWKLGGGEGTVKPSGLKKITQAKAMSICSKPTFVPSMSIAEIGQVLK